jgi:hypothetical protein
MTAVAVLDDLKEAFELVGFMGTVDFKAVAVLVVMDAALERFLDAFLRKWLVNCFTKRFRRNVGAVIPTDWQATR